MARRAWLDRWTAWTPALLLAALAGLTYWLDAQVQAPPDRPDGTARHDPDLILTDFRAERFDERGRVREALTAARAEHHPDDRSIDFARPTLTISAAERPQVTVSADHGSITGDQEVVVFRGNVHAERAASEPGQPGTKTGPLKLAGEHLRVLPRQERMDTDQPVTIEEPRGIIRAAGMEFDNRSQTLRFRGGIRGTLHPDPSAK
jgi:lipopolysaccharide export system protein LptC